MQKGSLIAGTGILMIAVGLFGVDYVLKERSGIPQETVDPTISSSASSASSVAVVSSSTSSSALSSSAQTVVSSSSSSTRVVKKGVSTKKFAGVDVGGVLARLQLVEKETDEAGFLSFVAQNRATTKTTALLKNNDRAYLFSWIDSPDAKMIFSSLKQALSEQFSGKLSGLIDETRTSKDGPPVDILSFLDPTLSPETVVFIRVRTRLYEIHVAKNGEATLDELVAELSK